MSLLSWIIPTHEKSRVVAEKQALRAELAATVVDFEERRSTVLKVADDAMKVMHEKGRGTNETF